MLLGNTKGTLERNILEPMRAIWSPALVGQIGSNNTVQIFGKKCHALGADKISQVSKLQGAAFEYCYGDEITTWHEDVFQMLKSRLSCPNSHFDGTCNPGNPQHWFKKFLDSDADIYRQAYTIDDNPFLAPEFVENLKREYAGTVYYNRFILGEWAAAEGVIYQDFANSVASRDERFVWKGKELPLMAVNIGVDFGGNGSKHAFVATGILSGYSGVVLLASRRVEPSTPQALERRSSISARRCILRTDASTISTATAPSKCSFAVCRLLCSGRSFRLPLPECRMPQRQKSTIVFALCPF